MCLSFYLSLRTLPFGIAVAIEFAGPLSVAVWSSRRPVDFVWIALAVAGLALLLPLGHDINTLDPTGMAWAALGGTGWACYIIFGKRVGHLPVSITAPLGAAMAALVVVPVGVVHAGTALLAPDVLLTSLGVALQCHSHFAGTVCTEASAQKRFWHHDQHGACRGGLAGAAATW